MPRRNYSKSRRRVRTFYDSDSLRHLAEQIRREAEARQTAWRYRPSSQRQENNR